MVRTRRHCRWLLMIAGILALPSPAATQTRPFLFSVISTHDPGATRLIAYTDIAYGQDLFAGVGQEALESRVGSQWTLGPRTMLVSHVGWAAGSDVSRSRVTVQAEALMDVLPRPSRGMFAIGVGARREYDGSKVALGRMVAGYRWTHTTAVANMRLEHVFAREKEDARRDQADVFTTFGLSREVGEALHVGVESVAEDLEGIFESDEAEGGAKLMVGPSLGFGPPGAPWHLLLAGGPAFRLTRSTATGPSPAPRDLTTRTGYVVRTSLDYRW